MKFDPAVDRKSFDEFALQFTLDTQYEEGRPMGNIAASCISDVICASLVGLYVPIAPILPRALPWIDRALQEKEETFYTGTPEKPSYFHRSRLHQAKALGLWLLNGDKACDEWNLAREANADALLLEKDVWSKSRIPTARLDEYMAYSFLAGQSEVGVIEFEKYHGEKNISLKKELKPREFAYALCLQKLKDKFDEADLFAAGRRMLQANLDENWLGRGLYSEAAIWLKIVYSSRDLLLTPVQIIWKAYDDMPNVARPDFLKNI